MKYKFMIKTVHLPRHDADIEIVFPGGKILLIQARPSNADEDYNGSLDIILPENDWISNWQGDDLQPAKVGDRPHDMFAKQLITELPGEYE